MPFVEVTLIEGRTKEAKRALMKALTDAVESTVGAPRESIRVVLREVPAEHWASAAYRRGSGRPDRPRVVSGSVIRRRQLRRCPSDGDGWARDLLSPFSCASLRSLPPPRFSSLSPHSS